MAKVAVPPVRYGLLKLGRKKPVPFLFSLFLIN